MSTNSNELKSQSQAILNSWKEIACYFGRGVRTVQRWEQELELPVHRIGKGKRSPVFAVVSELNEPQPALRVESTATNGQITGEIEADVD